MDGFVRHDGGQLYGRPRFKHRYHRIADNSAKFTRKYCARHLDHHRVFPDDDDTGGDTGKDGGSTGAGAAVQPGFRDIHGRFAFLRVI